MNREELKELGLTDEQIESVMSSHGKTVNATKEELNTVTTDRDNLKTQLSDRDTQLENLKMQSKGNDDLQATIDSLKEANNEAKEAHQKQLNDLKFGYELDQALLSEKARNPRAVKALLDTDTIKLNEEGQLIGLTEQLTNLKETDDYLFAGEGDNTPPPAPNHIPGSNQKMNNPGNVDPREAGRQKAMERHKKEEK